MPVGPASLRNYSRDDASRSTSRLTLGVLLAEELDLSHGFLKGRLNSGRDGEARLMGWINTNARLAWVENQKPGVMRMSCFCMQP